MMSLLFGKEQQDVERLGEAGGKMVYGYEICGDTEALLYWSTFLSLLLHFCLYMLFLMYTVLLMSLFSTVYLLFLLLARESVSTAAKGL